MDSETDTLSMRALVLTAEEFEQEKSLWPAPTKEKHDAYMLEMLRGHNEANTLEPSTGSI